MDAINAAMECIQRNAELFNSLDKCTEETPHYDLMSDSLWWRDEVPANARPSEIIWPIRPLLHHRSTLILGNPDQRWTEAWRDARIIIPRWIGFAPNRSSPEWSGFLASEKAKALSALHSEK